MAEQGIDISFVKDFGPYTKDFYWHEGTEQINKGRDWHMNDSYILRYLAAREFNIQRVIKELVPFLEWRQTNIPVPKLDARCLNIINKGHLYIHGRTRDMSPIMILDFKRMAEMLEKEESDNKVFCQMHNFMSNYLTFNMLVTGQVERWVLYVNIN